MEDEIKQQIKDEAKKRLPKLWETMSHETFIEGAEYGYSLANTQPDINQQLLEALKAAKAIINKRQDDSRTLMYINEIIEQAIANAEKQQPIQAEGSDAVEFLKWIKYEQDHNHLVCDYSVYYYLGGDGEQYNLEKLHKIFTQQKQK